MATRPEYLPRINEAQRRLDANERQQGKPRIVRSVRGVHTRFPVYVVEHRGRQVYYDRRIDNCWAFAHKLSSRRGTGFTQTEARCMAKLLGGLAVGARRSIGTGRWVTGGWANQPDEVWIVISLDRRTILADG